MSNLCNQRNQNRFAVLPESSDNENQDCLTLTESQCPVCLDKFVFRDGRAIIECGACGAPFHLCCLVDFFDNFKFFDDYNNFCKIHFFVLCVIFVSKKFESKSNQGHS